MTDAVDELRSLLTAAVKRDGLYKLASGQTSDWYLDCREVTFAHPHVVGHVMADAMCRRAFASTTTLGAPIDVIAGVPLGGVPIATAVAMDMGWDGPEIPTVAIRKDVKHHGRDGHVVGATWDKPERPKVWLVDDVFTTGGSLLEAAHHLRDEWDCDPAGYAVLFNRNPEAQGATFFHGTPFVAAYSLADLGLG